MGNAVFQPSLSGGELSNYLAGRVDLQRYQNSVKLCRNWITRINGGLTNRSGFRFLANVADSTKRARLIPFSFNTTQTYALEFGNQTLRFYSQGAIINTPAATVTGVSFGTGNGSTTVFGISPVPASVTAIIRNDWQGGLTLSANPRSNLLSVSGAEDQSTWTPNTGVTLTGAQSDPSGTSKATTIAYGGGGASGDIRITSPTVRIGSPGSYTASIYLKAASATTVVLDFNGTQVSCAVTTSWQRFTVTASVTEIPTVFPYAYFIPIKILSPSGSNTSFTLTSAFGQLELNASATPYISPALGYIADYSYSNGSVTFTQPPVSGAGLLWSGTTTGTIPYQLSTPYASSDLSQLSWTQNADTLTLVHPNYPPYELKRLGATSWTLMAMEFNSGPFQEINTDTSITIVADGYEGSINLTASKPIFLSEQVNYLLYLQQTDYGKPWNAGVSVTVGTIRRSGGRYYNAVSAGTTGTWAPINTTGRWYDGGVYWEYLHSGFGVCRINTVSGDGLSATASVLSRLPDTLVVGSTSGTVNISGVTWLGMLTYLVITTSAAHGLVVNDSVDCVVNYLDTNGHPQVAYFSAQVTAVNSSTVFVINKYGGAVMPNYSSLTGTSTVSKHASQPSYLWAFGEFNGTRGFPQSVCYHQQRLVFAGSPSKPQGVWMSRTNAFGDFSESDPIQDDDSITFGLASSQVNSVKNLISLGQLLALASDGEWVIGGASQAPITPTSLSAVERGYYGSSNLPVLGVGKSALYVQSKGQSVREVIHDFAYGYDSYSGSDLSIFASHLFEGHTLKEWAFQTVPFWTAWVVRDDGTLLGLTYNQEQQIAAWHRHDTQGTFESVCCISEGSEDVLYAIVNRTINGATVRSVERMDSRVITDLMGACFVDCAISFDGRNTGSTTITVSGGTTWDNTDSVTLTASSSTFASTDPGSQIVWVDASGVEYRLTITAYMSPTVVTARPERLLPVAYRSTARTDWAFARLHFSGATNLAGEAVSIVADGFVVANANTDTTPFTVAADGTFSLSNPAYRLTVGLPIQADIQTLNVNIQAPDTVMDKKKVIPVVRAILDQSCPLFAGRDFDHLDEMKIRLSEFYDDQTNLLTGIAEVRIESNWGKDGSICIRNNYPQPSNILSLIPELTVGGP